MGVTKGRGHQEGGRCKKWIPNKDKITNPYIVSTAPTSSVRMDFARGTSRPDFLVYQGSWSLIRCDLTSTFNLHGEAMLCNVKET
jgi:hypothetical protein